MVNGMLMKGGVVGFTYWNIGVLPNWGAKKKQGTREAIIDICGAGKYTGSLESLVFVTCDNGDHEYVLFTKAFVEKYSEEHGCYPPLQGDMHPMNDIIRVRNLQKSVRAGSSSISF